MGRRAICSILANTDRDKTRRSNVDVVGVLDAASVRMLRRVTLRLALLTFWAMAAKGEGTVTFSSLMLISSVVCGVLALTGHERLETRVLNNWDEASIYLLLYFGVRVFAA